MNSSSADALCPPLDATRDVVAARLGSVELEGTWHASYVLVHRREGDFVLLVLRDPADVVRLKRELPLRGSSCATLAQAIALILERFFLEPAGESANADPGTTGEGATAPSSPGSGRSTAEPARRDTGADARGSAAATSVPPSGSRRGAGDRPLEPAEADESAALTADLGLWATNAWLAPSVRLGRRIAGRFAISVTAGVDLAEHDTGVDAGWVQTRRVPAAVGVLRWLSEDELVRSLLAAELLGVVEFAESGGLAENGDGTRFVPGAGLRFGADFLDGSVRPFADLTGAVLFEGATRAFRVDDREVAAPPLLVVGAFWGIRAAF